jgi:hypothetical protein
MLQATRMDLLRCANSKMSSGGRCRSTWRVAPPADTILTDGSHRTVAGPLMSIASLRPEGTTRLPTGNTRTEPRAQASVQPLRYSRRMNG